MESKLPGQQVVKLRIQTVAERLFGCWHRNVSRPFTISGRTYPLSIATVHNVIQRVDMPQTGTIFLLNDKAVTVVRRPLAEQEHRAELLWKQLQN